MEKYELRSCTVDDAPGLAKNNASAFWEEEWWNILWENRTLDSLIEAFTARLPKTLLTDRSVRRHQKIVHVSSGEVVGYARWILPESHRHEWLEAQIPDLSDQDRQRFDKAYANANFTTRGLDDMDNPVLDMLRRHRPTEPFVKLDYLGVHPDHQRKGIASMLVRSGIQQSNRLGMSVYLVAMGRKALGMYQRLGFELLEESVQELSKWGGRGLYETFVLIKRSS
ncbi:hypothetical protein ACO1O0_005854 [Amphichorda felina]